MWVTPREPLAAATVAEEMEDHTSQGVKALRNGRHTGCK